MNSILGEISYDDVSFRFGGSSLHLSKIELSVNAGLAASWNQSGSGKSTLTKL